MLILDYVTSLRQSFELAPRAGLQCSTSKIRILASNTESPAPKNYSQVYKITGFGYLLLYTAKSYGVIIIISTKSGLTGLIIALVSMYPKLKLYIPLRTRFQPSVE